MTESHYGRVMYFIMRTRPVSVLTSIEPIRSPCCNLSVD
jgi:hypothetical protein